MASVTTAHAFAVGASPARLAKLAFVLSHAQATVCVWMELVHVGKGSRAKTVPLLFARQKAWQTSVLATVPAF